MAIQFKIIDHVALVTLDAQQSNNALTLSDLMHLRKTLGACQDCLLYTSPSPRDS